MSFYNSIPQPEQAPEVPSRPPVEVNAELRDIFNPLCIAAAEVAQPDAIATREPELFDEVSKLPAHIISNDKIFFTLPWDVAIGSDLSEWQALRENIKSTRENYGALSEEHGKALDDIEDYTHQLEVNYAERHPDASPSELRGVGFEIRVRFGGIKSLDTEALKRYEDQIAQLDPAEQLEIATFRKLQRTNTFRAYWFSDEMQTSERSVFAHNRYANSKDISSNLTVPIGAYGMNFAQKNLATAALIQAASGANIQQIAAEVTEGHKATLGGYTARAAEAPEVNATTTMETLQEGILSVMQSVAILTQEKVEGYDDPIALLEDIVNSGLIERLARYAPMGFVGPMALAGKYWPNSLVRTENGVAFSESFEGYLKEQRDKYIGEFMVRANSESLPENVSRAIGRV